MTTEQFELRKARRWPWLVALAILLIAIAAFAGGAHKGRRRWCLVPR